MEEVIEHPGESSEARHRSKEMIRDLGKRSACYLKVVHTANDPSGAFNNTLVVDDVGCPVANVTAVRLEAIPGQPPKLILELISPNFEIVT